SILVARSFDDSWAMEFVEIISKGRNKILRFSFIIYSFFFCLKFVFLALVELRP
ncbi:MAG: hypothetical protein ACI9C9_002215, partial [Marivirga sp.]